MIESRDAADRWPVDDGAEIAVLTAITSGEPRRLVATNPALAETRARETLRQESGDCDGVLLLGAALRCRGDAAAARAILEPLVQSQPQMAAAHFELGLALGELGECQGALTTLSRAIDLSPGDTDIWYALVH